MKNIAMETAAEADKRCRKSGWVFTWSGDKPENCTHCFKNLSNFKLSYKVQG